MRRETFNTPGPLRLEVRVPSGRIDLESVEGDETIVELEASPEIEEEARIEMRPRRDGHEVIVVIEDAGIVQALPRRRSGARVRSAGRRRRALDGLG